MQPTKKNVLSIKPLFFIIITYFIAIFDNFVHFEVMVVKHRLGTEPGRIDPPFPYKIIPRLPNFLYSQDGYRLNHIVPSGFSWFSSFFHHANDYQIDINNNAIIIKKINNLPASKSRLNLSASLR